MIKYKATITAIGPYVSEFVDHNILVLFGQNAPEELAEFTVLHDGTMLNAPLTIGDLVYVGDESVKILAVGDVANANLENLGHLVLKFNGENEPEMPGDVCVEKKTIPDFEVGTVIKITGDV